MVEAKKIKIEAKKIKVEAKKIKVDVEDKASAEVDPEAGTNSIKMEAPSTDESMDLGKS